MEEKTKTNLTTYTYLYNCQRWWGVVSGVRNLAHNGKEADVIQTATEIAETLKSVTKISDERSIK